MPSTGIKQIDMVIYQIADEVQSKPKKFFWMCDQGKEIFFLPLSTLGLRYIVESFRLFIVKFYLYSFTKWFMNAKASVGLIHFISWILFPANVFNIWNTFYSSTFSNIYFYNQVSNVKRNTYVLRETLFTFVYKLEWLNRTVLTEYKEKDIIFYQVKLLENILEKQFFITTIYL